MRSVGTTTSSSPASKQESKARIRSVARVTCGLNFRAKARVLQLAEVEVFSGGKNVAARGVPTQSSTADGAAANRAIDGRTDGDFTRHSVTQTESSDNPWWEIDLAAVEPIERVVVWGRTGRRGNARWTACDGAR